MSSISDKVKDLKKYEGFFNFYWDDNTGKIYLEIDQLNTEFLYLTSLGAGLGSNDVGLDRGLRGSEKVVKFIKTGPRIFMVQPNYKYRASSSDGNERRAVEESFAQSTLWGFQIEAVTGNRYLVDATDFFLQDAMQVSTRLQRSKQGNFTIDKSRSSFYLPNTRNFPLNTEIETTITFVNKDNNAGQFVRSVTPSSDAITLRMHHSLVQLPDEKYQPREFDPRSGYFNISYMDYSTPVSEPIDKYFICRHRLEKKNPSATLGEPVKPIIYYLDNGTPEPIRSALLEGASWWNQAFEAAGFKNAFQVKILPDDADPMDIRYNIINWVHRSTRGWSYGASVIDPRTGEIIKGNVTLGSLRVRQDYLIAQGLLAPFENGLPKDDKMMKMALARLKQLAAHEVGHTLGLQHNYIASATGGTSVMDYPPPAAKLTKDGKIDVSQAYSTGIGDWDKVAITWGYGEFKQDEKSKLNKILDDARKKNIAFLPDQDARSAGSMHPQTHLWDTGTDAVAELGEIMKIRSKALTQFNQSNIREGMPLAMLEDVLVPIYFYHRYQLEAAVKTVGGMYYSYTVKGDGGLVTRPVTREQQMQALDRVISCIDPAELALPERVIKMIPPRPSGYKYSNELFKKRTGLAFDALSPAEAAVDFPLSFLFNSQRLNRMVQFGVQEDGLGVDEMLDFLLDKTWKSPRRKGMEGLIQMQTEQILLTYLLSSGLNESNSFPVRAILVKAVAGLKDYINDRLKSNPEASYKAHLMLALERMASPEKAMVASAEEMPPGAPIGCGWDD